MAKNGKSIAIELTKPQVLSIVLSPSSQNDVPMGQQTAGEAV